MSENANNNDPKNSTTTPTPEATTTQATPSQTTSDPVENDSALAQLGLKTDAPAEPKADDATPAPAAEPAAETYELELDDNSPLTEKDLDEVVALASKYKWPKEVAEKYLKDRESAYTLGEKSLRDKAAEHIRKQKEAFLKDPDFQGEKLKESLETIDLVVKQYGEPGLAEFLKGPGGNNLAFAKTMLKIGKILKQDAQDMGKDLTAGKGKSNGASGERTRESALKDMYPSFFPEA